MLVEFTVNNYMLGSKVKSTPVDKIINQERIDSSHTVITYDLANERELQFVERILSKKGKIKEANLKMNKIAKRITALDESAEKFVQECKDSGKFDWWLILQIVDGLSNGLSIEQVKLYAQPGFDWDQFWEIREALQQGLSIDKVKVYADPKFDNWQMKAIREGFESGLTMEQVKLYAKPEIDDEKMDDIRDDLEDGMSIEEVKEEYNL